jgi:hypothetical protein
MTDQEQRLEEARMKLQAAVERLKTSVAKVQAMKEAKPMAEDKMSKYPTQVTTYGGKSDTDSYVQKPQAPLAKRPNPAGKGFPMEGNNYGEGDGDAGNLGPYTKK